MQCKPFNFKVYFVNRILVYDYYQIPPNMVFSKQFCFVFFFLTVSNFYGEFLTQVSELKKKLIILIIMPINTFLRSHFLFIKKARASVFTQPFKMKNIISLVLLQLAFSSTFLPASHHVSALELHGSGAATSNLVETTCKKTPFYNLCLSTLQSDPRSSKADVAGLAHIGADKVKARATATLRQITGLLKGAKDPKLKTALRDCFDLYNTIIKYDIPVVIEAVVKGNPKFGVQGAADAANEANDCERRFVKSPISGSNKAVHDLSTVVASIVQLLL